MKDEPELQRRAAEQAAIARADFLRRYDLQRLPSNPSIRRRAAEMLRGQGQEELAHPAVVLIGIGPLDLHEAEVTSLVVT